MSQILRTLFFALEPTQQTAAEQQAMQTVEGLVRGRLTETELDLLWAAAMEMDEAKRLDSFQRGFRLGTQLALEGTCPLQLDD